MVGDLDKSSFSNIEQQSLEFVKYTLDPWVIRWEQSLQRSLLCLVKKGKYFIKLNVDGLLRRGLPVEDERLCSRKAERMVFLPMTSVRWKT